VQQPTRRRILKFGIAGAALASGGTWVYRTVGRFGPAAPGYQVFDENEVAVLEAACEAYFPGPPDFPISATEAGTAQFVDRYVGGLYSDTQLLIRALLRTINVSTLLTHGRVFRWLSVGNRFEVLERWTTSSLRVRRAGNQSLRFMINMGYMENEKVRTAMGFTEGCTISQEGRPQGI
jgi:hypothetical protein